MVDARKPLEMLRGEWETCTKCDLGKRRQAMHGSFVFGEGEPRGVLFVGEGPGRYEEEYGRPFVGASGQLLRDVLTKLGFTHYYLTNIVTCRACEPVLDPTTGLQKFYKQKRGPDIPAFKDQVPLPDHMEACLPRLYEEIYLVDPVLIVTLGATASKVLLKRPISITNERGRTEHCSIPGGTMRAVLTEKKQAWGRKVQGQYVLPTEPNEVSYLVLPTLHPAYVLRRIGDLGPNSPIRQFGEDIRKAAKIYWSYAAKVTGAEELDHPDTDIATTLSGDTYGPAEDDIE